MKYPASNSSLTLLTKIKYQLYVNTANRLFAAPAVPHWLSGYKTHLRSIQCSAYSSLTPTFIDCDPAINKLPLFCPGCGAFSKVQHPGEPGYYSLSRNIFRHKKSLAIYKKTEQSILREVLETADPSTLLRIGIPTQSREEKDEEKVETPLCDRCHSLVHESKGQSIVHPSLQAIADILNQSTHKYNHIYYLLDAADFPLSLVPELQRVLPLNPQRSVNRRSKTSNYLQGRKYDVSFVITRSDLLAPRKEQIDSIMPFLVDVLRNALPHRDERFRLGNVYCVSAHRGWWTKKLREDVWKRGGGNWLIGKVNVGKTSLLRAIFPKGAKEGEDMHPDPQEASQRNHNDYPQKIYSENKLDSETSRAGKILEEARADSILPPILTQNPYPVMPIVSQVAGTTAAPVRLPFGRGRGELIDLPGFACESIGNHVLQNKQVALFMQQRVRAVQYSIKPGQSLVVSNLIRITPLFDDLVLLACPFLMPECHVTHTAKAEAILAQRNSTSVFGVARPGTADLIASAGFVEVKWDVTKERSGPLTAPDAVKLNPEVLPFIVYSTDVLIEGLGWIELTVQVRRRALERESARSTLPTVEIYSPNGKFISTRRPLNLSVIGRHRRPVSRKAVRPRRSKKGEKKLLKIQKLRDR